MVGFTIPDQKGPFFLGQIALGDSHLGGLGPLDILDSHDTCLLHQLASSTQHPALSHTGVVWAPPESGQIQERLRLRRDDLPNFQGSKDGSPPNMEEEPGLKFEGGAWESIYIYIVT